MVGISGWFSVRNGRNNLTGLNINVRNVATNAIVATTSTQFFITEPIGLWKFASIYNIPVAAGAHIFEVDLPNSANVDLVSLIFKPALQVTKTSKAVWDGVSVINPKMITGAVSEYTIRVTSPADYTVADSSILISDATPAYTALIVTDIGGAGSGPAAVTAGSTGLSYSFFGLSSTVDDIEFSSDNGLSWTYTPAPDSDGTDPNVTHVRVKPKGAMAVSSTLEMQLRYRIN